MKRYSHNNEDEYLDGYFKDINTGFFVDIGANDGITGSNTRRLFDKGWTGVAVEASPKTFDVLVKNYANQDRVRLVHAAITDTLGSVKFWENPKAPLWGLNSAHKPWIDCFDVGTFEELTVPSMRLQDLGLPQEFEFLSVDTEGGDLLILGTLNEQVRPKLICAEMDKFDYAAKIHETLKLKGYKHAATVEGNSFFERV
jgi:FkbM family methyltransferase